MTFWYAARSWSSCLSKANWTRQKTKAPASSRTTVIAAATASTSRVTIGRSPTSRRHELILEPSFSGHHSRAIILGPSFSGQLEAVADPAHGRDPDAARCGELVTQAGDVHLQGVAADVDL